MCQQNIQNEAMDGVAIAVKTSVRHRIEDDYLSEMLAIVTDTPDGPVTTATSYLTPRRPYILHPDFLSLFRRQTPVFLFRDLNARHMTLGCTSTNQVGCDLMNYLTHQAAIHIEPHFPTYYGPLSMTSPASRIVFVANHSRSPEQSLSLVGKSVLCCFAPLCFDTSLKPLSICSNVNFTTVIII